MKSKNNIIIAIVSMVLIAIFNFLVLQTNFFQDVLNLQINCKPVLVATKNIYENDMINESNTELAWVNINDLITDENGEYLNYILTSPAQLVNGYMATANIMKGEQIPNTRFTKKANIQTDKTKLYNISLTYETSAGNALYKGDKAELWYMVRDENNKLQTRKLFNKEIIVVMLKNGEGLEINTDRTLPATIPAKAFIYVDDNDIVTINELLDRGAQFFFIKSAY